MRHDFEAEWNETDKILEKRYPLESYMFEPNLGKVLEPDFSCFATKELVLLFHALKLLASATRNPLWPRCIQNEHDETKNLLFLVWAELVVRPDRAEFSVIPEDQHLLE